MSPFTPEIIEVLQKDARLQGARMRRVSEVRRATRVKMERSPWLTPRSHSIRTATDNV